MGLPRSFPGDPEEELYYVLLLRGSALETCSKEPESED